jgi:hypothetical protein
VAEGLIVPSSISGVLVVSFQVSAAADLEVASLKWAGRNPVMIVALAAMG